MQAVCWVNHYYLVAFKDKIMSQVIIDNYRLLKLLCAYACSYCIRKVRIKGIRRKFSSSIRIPNIFPNHYFQLFRFRLVGGLIHHFNDLKKCFPVLKYRHDCYNSMTFFYVCINMNIPSSIAGHVKQQQVHQNTIIKELLKSSLIIKKNEK